MGTAAVSRPNPTSFIPSRSPAYRSSTDHAAPYVLLKGTIGRARVRIGGCATGRRVPASTTPAPPGRPGGIEPDRGKAGDDAEQRDRQILAQERPRDQEGVARMGGQQQRSSRDNDAIADVVDERRRQEPPKARSDSRRRNSLDNPG